MGKIATRIALLLAVCMSAAPLDMSAARDVSELLVMGPDPGGKSGETVTPETTKTDHPAASGPSHSTPSGAKGGSGNEGDGSTAKRDRVPTQGNTDSISDTASSQR